MKRRIVIGISAAVSALLLSSTASASTSIGGPTNASDTLTGVHETLPLLRVKAMKYPVYTDREPTRFDYYAVLKGITPEPDSVCTFTFNDSLLSTGMCADIVTDKGMPLAKSGEYILSIDGADAASWMFVKPAVKPPVLPVSVCQTGTVTVYSVTASKLVMGFPTNGKCRDGAWSYSFIDSKGTTGTRKAKFANNRMTLSFPRLRDRVALTLTYTPHAMQQIMTKHFSYTLPT